MKNILKLGAVVWILWLSCTYVAALDEQTEYTRVPLPGTVLSLLKPKGFENATAFHGFQQESTGASILVSVIPGPYSEVTKGFVASKLAEQGIEIFSRDDTKIANQQALLLYVSQQAYGQQYYKWVAVFGNETQTQLVLASFPAGEGERLRDSMREVVMTATLTEETLTAPTLPFSLGQVEGLKLVSNIAGVGKMMLFTKDGTMPIASPSDPYFIAAPSLGQINIEERQEFAVERLKNSANTVISKVGDISDIRIDGQGGIQIEATGRDRKSETALRLYQVMLFPQTGGYILMHGAVGLKNIKFDYSKFRTLAKTYRAK